MRQSGRRGGSLRGRGAGQCHARHEAGQFPEPALRVTHDRMAVECRHHLSHLRAALTAKVPHEIVDERRMLPRRRRMKTFQHEPPVGVGQLHRKDLRAAEAADAQRFDTHRCRITPTSAERKNVRRESHRGDSSMQNTTSCRLELGDRMSVVQRRGGACGRRRGKLETRRHGTFGEPRGSRGAALRIRSEHEIGRRATAMLVLKVSGQRLPGEPARVDTERHSRCKQGG